MVEEITEGVSSVIQAMEVMEVTEEAMVEVLEVEVDIEEDLEEP